MPGFLRIESSCDIRDLGMVALLQKDNECVYIYVCELVPVIVYNKIIVWVGWGTWAVNFMGLGLARMYCAQICNTFSS